MVISTLSRLLRLFRSSEWVLIGYFLYATGVSLILPVSGHITRLTIFMNALVLGGLALLAYADSFRRTEFLGIVRDWYVPPLMLLAYREMGWFALPHTSVALEEAWVVWDRCLLNEAGLRAAIEILGPVLPVLLELSYAFVYAMPPFALAMLYVYRRRQRADAFLFPFALAVLSVYVLFPFFPSEPPWTVFPGEDFPSYDTPVRRFNAAMLGSQGIHTSVFPSAHVAGSFSVAFAMVRLLPEKKWVGRLLVALATCIAVATVYGRYHYAVDAVAGFAISLAATAISARRTAAPALG
jgi:membrane-associated phospholipid phosphatase